MSDKRVDAAVASVMSNEEQMSAYPAPISPLLPEIDKLAGHRFDGEHDCFLANCKGLGHELADALRCEQEHAEVDAVARAVVDAWVDRRIGVRDRAASDALDRLRAAITQRERTR